MKEEAATKSEIEVIMDRIKKIDQKKIRTTKETKYNPETETYVHRIRKGPGSKQEIITTWGDRVLDKGFTMIPNVLIENYRKIGLRDKHMILIALLLRYGYKKSQAYPAQKTIADKTGYGIKTIQRLIREMKLKGYMTVYKRYIKPEHENPRRTSNVYDLKGLMSKLQAVAEEEK